MLFRICVLGSALLLSACAGKTIVPNYQNSNPFLQVGGEQPANSAPVVENAGSFCLEVSEVWHSDGKTPDGQKLWARDTLRKVVPCP